ncbi:MAG: hypothetical protein LBM08_05070, partial [Dysgonamonadaceae bacterium]|nr:hypothetical protein [Dysgonamonadaceae bacterium]
MWKPIVDTGKRADILRKITEIAEKLYEVPCNRESSGLLTGNAGIALFMYHYGMWCGKEAFYEKALDLLSGCIDFCHENRRMLYSFCNGVAGL